MKSKTLSRSIARLTVCLLLSLPIAAFCACSKKTSQEPTTEEWLSQKGWSEVTPEEVAGFGKQLETALANSNKVAFNQMFDLSNIAERGAAGLLTGKDMREYKKGVLETDDLFRQLTVEGAKFTFLRSKECEMGHGALFRLLLSTGECNYHHWYLVKDGNGKIQVADVFIFMTGEKLSQTFRQLLLTVLPGSILERLSGKEKLVAANGEKLQGLTTAFRQQRFQDVSRIFNSLPEELQNKKAVMLFGIQAAANTSEVEYKEMLERYLSLYPDDPSVPLVSLDLDVMNENYDRALKSLDTLDRAIGEDTHLLDLRAGLYVAQEDYVRAREVLKQIEALEPGREDTHWALLGLNVTEKNYQSAVEDLRVLNQEFGYVDFNFSTEELYREFEKSEECQEFLKSIR